MKLGVGVTMKIYLLLMMCAQSILIDSTSPAYQIVVTGFVSDCDEWMQRLKEEYKTPIAYTSMNNPTTGFGSPPPIMRECDGPTNVELELPQLDGKMQKMYKGRNICLNVHPLWAKNGPRFGIAHAICLGLAPWLASEIPVLVDSGMIKHKDDAAASNS